MSEITAITDEIIDAAVTKTTRNPAPEKNEIDTTNHSIVFYCKICKEVVDAKRKGKSLTFTCPTCQKDKIAMGTQKSIENFYLSSK